jgi:hypothetical protein
MKLKELFEDVEDYNLGTNTDDEDDYVPDTNISPEMQEALDAIKRDCQPFLKQIENQLLFRGSIGALAKGEFFFKRDVRMDRVPKSTDQIFHDAMDKWFNKKFGFRARSAAVFTTGNYHEAFEYGGSKKDGTFAIFPIGDFRFVWSPKVTDLFFEADPDKMGEDAEKAEEHLDTLNYKDTDLPAAIRSRKEVMVSCKSYYMLRLRQNDQKHILKVLRA